MFKKLTKILCLTIIQITLSTSLLAQEKELFLVGDSTQEQKLAEFRYKNGMRIVFTYDQANEEFGLMQEGLNGVSSPIITGDIENMLDTYLMVAPLDAPVPEILFQLSNNYSNKLDVTTRELTQSVVRVNQLYADNYEKAPTYTDCDNYHLSWFHWFDPGQPGLAPKTYYSSSYGGKFKDIKSYVQNCTPKATPSYIWARHRVYYKLGNTYIKQAEAKVAPGHWNVLHRGNSRQYRRVKYDDGWNSSPSCSNCVYTREGRYFN
ncbi:MAG TPA: hypothetical protein ENJ44_05560 [Oceanospirillales bacterium]|nr:hypothetical protein [Oceanospirillales bacterium]